jgi:hypothetical protein
MIDLIAGLAGMFVTNEALAAEKKPQPAPVVVEQVLCSKKDPAKIKECLDAKFKDDRDPHADMWNPNWINRR